MCTGNGADFALPRNALEGAWHCALASSHPRSSLGTKTQGLLFPSTKLTCKEGLFSVRGSELQCKRQRFRAGPAPGTLCGRRAPSSPQAQTRFPPAFLTAVLSVAVLPTSLPSSLDNSLGP